MRPALQALAHLAVWAGLYIAGASVCLAQVAGLNSAISLEARLRGGAFAFCTAVAVYLLDRVKLHDTWLDPADAQAHPARFAFLARHAGAIRVLILGLLLGASWLGSGLIAWGWAIPWLAGVGVLVYAGKPRAGRARPKDIVVLKNLYVAAGITGFAAIVALASARPGGNPLDLWRSAWASGLPLMLSCVHLGIRVFADAALCDLDDEEADRAHGTGTLPTYLGRARAWNTAMGLRVLLCVAVLMLPWLPAPARYLWAGVTVASSLTLRFAAPSRVRDWVDVRLPIEAAMVWAALAWWT